MRKSMLPAVAGALAALAAMPARADWDLLNMPVGASELSREIYDMHMIMLWICLIIAVLTFGAMIFAMVRFRKSKGAVADQKLLHNARLEAAWTIIPVLILIGMALPSVEKLVKIEDTSGSGLTIKITGYQWQWHYEYLGSGVSLLQPARAHQRPRPPERLRHRPEYGRELPARGGQAAGRPDRHQDPHPADRE